MKNSLLALFVLGLMLTACESGTSTVEVEWNTETTDEVTDETVESDAELYTWEKHGLSFEVPAGLVPSDHIYVDALFLDTMDISTLEGDFLGQLSIRPQEETSIEAVITKYSNEEAFMQEDVVVNGKTYVHISFISDFADYENHMYLIENEGAVYSVNKNVGGSQEDLDLVLETLEF